MPPGKFALFLAAVIAAAGATIWGGWALSGAVGIDGRGALAVLALLALVALVVRARTQRRH